MADEVITIEIGKRVVRFRYCRYPEGGTLTAVEGRQVTPAAQGGRVYTWNRKTGAVMRYNEFVASERF